jgi:hypothetical protein
MIGMAGSGEYGVGSLELMIRKAMLDNEFVVSRRYAPILAKFSRFNRNLWPASQIGLVARVAFDYQNCWMNFAELCHMIREDVPESSRVSDLDLVQLLRKEVARIGTRSYSLEWRDDESQHQIQDKIEASTDITVLINRFLSDVSEKHVLSVFEDITREKTYPNKRDRYIFMDLGCGEFGVTSMSHMAKLNQLSELGLIPSNYNDYVEVVVVDVDPNATYKTAQRLSRPQDHGYFFRPPRRIERVNTNFMDIDSNLALRKYEGMMDTQLAGASLCHVTDLNPVFRFMNYLSSYRGAVFVWDWLAKTFAARYLRMPRMSRDGGIFVLETSIRDKGERISVVTEDPSSLSVDFHESVRGRRWRSVYELAPGEVAAHHSNMYAWLGYWGFIKRGVRDDSIEQREFGGRDIWDYYLEMFSKLAETDRGFSPIDDFVIDTLGRGRKQGLTPLDDSRVRYNFIESYGSEYFIKMQQAGMRAVDIPFDELLSSIRRLNGAAGISSSPVEDLSATQKEIRHALRVSIGCRDRDYFGFLTSSLGNGR